MLRDRGLMLLLGCWALAVACPPDPKPDPVPPPPRPAPPPIVPEPMGDGCTLACVTLGRLGCPGARGSPGRDELYGTADDIACADACRGVEATGITTLATFCVQRATSCAAVDRCMEGSE